MPPVNKLMHTHYPVITNLVRKAGLRFTGWIGWGAEPWILFARRVSGNFIE